MEQRKWLLEVGSPLGENALKIVEMTRKDLQHDVNLVDKAVVAGFERIGCSFERTSTLGKMLRQNIAGSREVIRERQSPSI